MQIEAIYYGTAIAVTVKDFDSSNSLHCMLQNMLEKKGFKPDENPNTWIRRSFTGWDNYLFWKTEVDKLVEHFLKKTEPEPAPAPQVNPNSPVYSVSEEPLDLEKVADKIKKLFALSQSPNEAEAMAAFSKAQELLTRHNLSMSDLAESDLADSQPEEVEEQIIDESKRPSSWKGALLGAVAKANYCMFFSRHGGREGVKQMMLGRPVNIQSARMQFEYLVEAIERLARLEDGDRSFKNSFRLGAAHRLHTRIIEGMEKQKREGMAASGEDAPVTAIVMRSLYEKLESEVKAYAKDKLNLKIRTQRPANNSREGYVAGQSAGDRVSLNKQVGGANQRYLPG